MRRYLTENQSIEKTLRKKFKMNYIFVRKWILICGPTDREKRHEMKIECDSTSGVGKLEYTACFIGCTDKGVLGNNRCGSKATGHRPDLRIMNCQPVGPLEISCFASFLFPSSVLGLQMSVPATPLIFAIEYLNYFANPHSLHQLTPLALTFLNGK
jgi:hypothetical protein